MKAKNRANPDYAATFLFLRQDGFFQPFTFQAHFLK